MDQEKIGKFICELRKERNMTQEQFAHELGVTDKSISRWENGKTMPDISLLSVLAEKLNTTIPELLNGQKMTKDELIKLKETVENLIEYESNQQIKKSKRINGFLMLGSGLFLLAFIHSNFPYLNLIFTPNIADFVQGAMYGCSIALNVISIYNNSHNMTVQEKKKQLIKNFKNK